jgi:predicted SAM-dependent methyltransferase
MDYKFNYKGLALFELKSYIGRKILKKKLKLNENFNYLNLGCGDNYIEGYINADFFTRLKFWSKNQLKRDWQLDLRFPLDCSDNTFDGIFTEHTLEHFYPDECKNLLKELFRVLKPNSIIRITVPDLEKYVNFYTKNYSEINVVNFNSHYKNGCSAIRNMTQNYFHLSVWDYEELKNFLEEAGFTSIKKMEYGISQDEKLNLDIQERSWETLYVEAKKV